MNEPVIAWIHGFPLSSKVFERQQSIRGATHIMPDLPGFGGKAAAGPQSMDSYAREVLQALDARGIERAVFAGVSMGGYICFALARLVPERIAGLILIDTRETADSPEARQGRLQSIEQVRAAGSIAPVVGAMHPKMLSAKADAGSKQRILKIMNESSKDGVVAALQALADRPDSTSVLPQLRVPTLIVVGEEDTITPPSDAERMTAAIKGAVLVRLPGAGHLSQFDDAEAFNRAVETFLPTVTASRH